MKDPKSWWWWMNDLKSWWWWMNDLKSWWWWMNDLKSWWWWMNDLKSWWWWMNDLKSWWWWMNNLKSWWWWMNNLKSWWLMVLQNKSNRLFKSLHSLDQINLDHPSRWQCSKSGRTSEPRSRERCSAEESGLLWTRHVVYNPVKWFQTYIYSVAKRSGLQKQN